MIQTTRDNIVLIANEVSRRLGEKIAAAMQVPFTAMVKKQFADGEVYHAFPDDVSGKEVIIIGATHSDAAHQELLDLIAGSRYMNAKSVNVVVPFLGYSTMEQAKPDVYEIPKGVTRTRQIFRARPDLVAFVDLHSEAVLHAHPGDIRTVHIHTNELVVRKIREIGLEDFVLVSPDYGRSKWVARLASQLGAPHTAADKDRFKMDRTMVGQVASGVKDKTAIIFDDMIRTGGTIIQTAERCRQAGARDAILMATHLILAGNARQKMQEHGIRKVIGSDTYPGVENDGLLDVYSIAPLVATVLKKQLRLGD